MQWDGTDWMLVDDSTLTITETDGIIGNEVIGATNTTLTLDGTGVVGDEYTLRVSPLGITNAEIAANAVTLPKLADGFNAGEIIQWNGTDWVLIDQSALAPSFASITGKPVGLDDGDDDTTYSAGSGLSLTGTTFAVDNTTIAPVFSNLTSIPTGLLDGDDDTTYSAGTGLSLTGTTFAVDNTTIAPVFSNLTSIPTGLLDGDDDTTYSAGDAITLTGIVFSITDGDITSAKITNNTITDIDVATGAAIAGSKINPVFTDNVSTTGTLAVTGQTTINTGANSTTLPTDRGTANQVLTTNGAGAATWQTPTANPLKAIGKIDGAGGVLKITSGVTPTRNSLGNYTVDLSSLSLPDANYIIQLTLLGAPAGSTIQVTNQTAASFTVQISAIQQTFNPSPPIGFTTGDPDLPNMNAVAAHTHSGLVDTFIIEGTSIDPIDAQWYFTVTDF